jgi:hypothetical protein
MAGNHLDRQQVALVQRTAIQGDGIHLVHAVRGAHVAVRTQVVASQMRCDHVTLPVRPLALDAEQASAEIEDQVVPSMLGHRPEDGHAKLDCGGGDLGLGDRSLVVSGLPNHEPMFPWRAAGNGSTEPNIGAVMLSAQVRH